MHNRKKTNVAPSEAEVIALKKKAATYSSLIDVIFARRASEDYSQETFDAVGKLIKMNPDFYSLWNFRKEIIIRKHFPLPLGGLLSGPEFDALRDEELNLSTEGIKRNPKSYCAWFHRVWISKHFQINFDHELSLCSEFLKEDQRNFHCWNYRRYLVRYGKINPASELQFSEEKVKENFSNYSALHQRSVFLSSSTLPLQDLVKAELSLVESAVFTEPADQSAWWYHQFILHYTYNKVVASSSVDLSVVEWYSSMLKEQVDMMKGLLEVEEKCHWVMTCLVSLYLRILQVSPLIKSDVDNDSAETSGAIKELLLRLCEVDPAHINRYKYLLKNNP